MADVLRVATFNVNGIRAATRRGYQGWIAETAPDIVALQEVRCPVESLPESFPGGYHLSYDPGSLAGRNGVAVLTRQPPAETRTLAELEPLARGWQRFAHEGRYLEVDLADTPLTVGSVYIPKGGLPAHLQKPGRMREAPDGGAAYARKQAFLSAFARQLAHSRRVARAAGREFLLLGDLNLARDRYDLTNWRSSRRAVGFLPEERAWLSDLVGPRTLVDVVRGLHPETDGPYSWWSWLGDSFAKDVGWRIDLHLATPALASTAQRAWVCREPSRDERISDHAAVVVDYAA